MKKNQWLKRTLCGLLALSLTLGDPIAIRTLAESIPQEPTAVEKPDLIIKYKDETGKEAKLEQTKVALGLTEMESVKETGGFDLVQVSEEKPLEAVITELKKDTNIEYIQPNYPLETFEEPRYSEQWGLSQLSQVDINAAAGWKVTKGSPSVLVGVLDTGIDTAHPDLKANIYTNKNEIPQNGLDDDGNGYVDDVTGYDFYNHDGTVFDGTAYDTHGTHCAGTIAASENGEGTVGVAPKVKLVPLKFMHENKGYTADAIEAIQYARKMGVQIINCSFGGYDNNRALRDAMEESDILYICAAGNKGINIDQTPVYPAAFEMDNLVTVTAIDAQGALPSYANYGTRVELAAPGTGILSTEPEGGYNMKTGTSMAAPFATGVAALVKSQFPSMTNREIAYRLKTTGKKLPGLTGKTLTGTLLDAEKALTGQMTTAEQSTAPVTDTAVVQKNSAIEAFAATISPALQEAIHFGESGVNPGTGNYSTEATDFSMNTLGFTLNISRTYNSKDDRVNPIMGRGWTFGFEGYVKQDTTNTSLYNVKLPNGGIQVFQKSGSTYEAYDSRSTLVESSGWLLTTKDQYQYHFAANGFLDWMQDRNGNRITNEVNSSGKITTIADSVGRKFNFTYNANNQITSITDPRGVTVASYNYDASKRLTSAVDAKGRATSYEYDGSNYLTVVKNGSGIVTESITYNHADNHKVSSYTSPDGITNSKAGVYSYSVADRKTTITKDGKTLIKWYDTSFYTTKTQDPEGGTITVDYVTDSSGINRYGEERTVTDRNGRVTGYERDTRGNITKITNPDGGISTFIYDAKNNLTKETDEEGNKKYYIFDKSGLKLVKEVAPYSAAKEYANKDDRNQFAITTYDYQNVGAAKGMLVKKTLPNLGHETYTYDGYGNLATKKDDLGNTWVYTYNTVGWLLTEKSPRGYVTRYDYEDNGNLLKVTAPDGGVTKYEYNANNLKSSESTPKATEAGKKTLYEYNTAGRVTKITDSEGGITLIAYDGFGNETSRKLPNLVTNTATYDGLNRKTGEGVISTAGVATQRSSIRYSVSPEKETVITTTKVLTGAETAEFVETRNYRDAVTSVTNPDGGQKTIEYYKNGLIKTESTYEGQQTIYQYDGMGRVLNKWVPSQGAYRYEGYEYHPLGKPSIVRQGKDLVNPWEIPSYERQAIQWIAFDLAGNPIKITDKNGRRTDQAFDGEGNCIQKTIYGNDGDTFTEKYSYDYKNRITELTKFIGGRYLNEKGHGSGDAVPITTRNSYDTNGNLAKTIDGEGNTVENIYDTLNRLTETRESGLNEEGNAVSIVRGKTYEKGMLKTETDPLRNVVTYTYNTLGQKEKEERPVKELTGIEGGYVEKTYTTYYTYDTAGRMSTKVSPKAYGTSFNPADLSTTVRQEYTYDKMSQQKTVKQYYKDGTTLSSTVINAYQYDKEGRLIKTIGGEAFAAASGADEDSKIISAWGPGTRYDADGTVLQNLDGRNYGTRIERDGMGRKVKDVLADGAEILYTLNDAGNVTKITKRASSADPEQVIEKNTYDAAGNLLTKTDGRGNITTYSIAGLNLVGTVTYDSDSSIEGNTETYLYDRNLRTVAVSDTTGRKTEKVYDPQGRVLTETVSGGGLVSTIAYKYDKAGNLVYKLDPNGIFTGIVYDQLGRKMMQYTFARGTSNDEKVVGSMWQYDGNGNSIKEFKITECAGSGYDISTTENTYDDFNRVTKVEDGTGAIAEEKTYNKDHQQVESKTYQGTTAMVRKFEYDKSGNLIKTTDGEGHTETKIYDGLGRLLGEADGNGTGRSYEYDKVAGKVKTVTNALGEKTRFVYDALGNLLTQTDGNGNITTWKYNDRNLPLKRIDPLGITQKGGKNVYDPRKTESYTYYGDGSKKTMVDRNGVTTSYTYDVLGNETKKEAAGLTVTNKYDPAGNKVIMTDSSGKTTRAYDELNRCIIKNVPKVGSSTFEYSTIVDEGGVKYLAELFTDPTGKTTKTLLDKAGRPTLVIDPDNNKTKIEYYANGLKWKITQPGGATEVYTYFMDGTLKELKNTYGGKTDTYTYTYDATGNQLTKTEPQGSTTYTYDRLNRLVKVSEPTPEGQRTTEYAYDKAGNRIRQVVQTGSSAITATSYEYNEQNRLVSTTEETLGAGGVKAVETPGSKRAFIEYIYDSNGNLLYQKKAELTKLDPIAPAPKAHFSAFVMGQTTVEENPMVAWIGSNKYNAFNELIQSTQGGKAVSNGYNGEGLRVSKTVMGQTTNTLYVSDNPVLETDNSGKETGRTTYGAGIALSRKSGSETLGYLYNGHADVVALINSGGTAQATYTYDAFGVPLSSTGTAKNPIRYGGYEFDEETGYYYLKARFYDPKTARFLQEDTYRGNPTDPLSLNLYSYCSNNPVVYWDPTGHAKRSIDPSGSYHPDGSFTPKGVVNNGNTGTVSKEEMDNYYSNYSSGGSSSNNRSESDHNARVETLQRIFGLTNGGGQQVKATNNVVSLRGLTASVASPRHTELVKNGFSFGTPQKDLKSLIKEKINSGFSFIEGVNEGYIQSVTLNLGKFDSSESAYSKPAYYQGKFVGEAIVVVQGGVEVLVGVMGEGISIGAAPPSGGLSLALAPASAAAVAHGAASSGTAFYNLDETWTKYSESKVLQGEKASNGGTKKNTKTLWDIKTTATDKIDYRINGQNVSAYKDPNTGLYWAKDVEGHGGSAYKVFELKKSGKELQWKADADEFGNYIIDKHKGPKGLTIKVK